MPGAGNSLDMSKTLLLDTDRWDCVLDAAGNIAVATAPYQYAQDVACAIKLFLGELYYQQDEGVPYLTEVMGQSPPIGYFQALLEQAAKTVADVDTATCVIESVDGRTVTGQVQFTTTTGQTGTVSIGP